MTACPKQALKITQGENWACDVLKGMKVMLRCGGSRDRYDFFYGVLMRHFRLNTVKIRALAEKLSV